MDSGGFHIALNFLSAIGRLFEDSGLLDLLIESGVYGSSTASSILSGRQYARGVRAHKIVFEAMTRLQLKAFGEWLASREMNVDVSRINDRLEDCIKAVDCGAGDELRQANACIEGELDSLYSLFTQFTEEGRQRSQTFRLWSDYTVMVQILLEYIRAERTACWSLHLEATSRMLPYLFAVNHFNYARWVTVYLADMHLLPETAPEVYQQFQDGKHAVRRSPTAFSSVWSDMGLEQTVNRDLKCKGGIVGFSLKPMTVARWFLTAHERAAITGATKSMCGLEEEQLQDQHREARRQSIVRDEKDVQSLVEVIQERMIDPFQSEEALMNIASDIVVPASVAENLLTSYDRGQVALLDFVETRLNTNNVSFFEPVKTLRLTTFASLKKKMPKSETSKVASGNVDSFSRLVVVAKKRSIDLEEIFRYELTPVPLALVRSDGSLNKTAKCSLLAELEATASVVGQLPCSPLESAVIVDAMMLVQMFKPESSSTFGDVGALLMNIVLNPLGQRSTNVATIHVVFDRYDRADSVRVRAGQAWDTTKFGAAHTRRQNAASKTMG